MLNAVSTRSLLVGALAVAAPPPALAVDAASIGQKMRALQIQRWKGVNSYLVVQEVMGTTTLMLFERDVVTDADGDEVPAFRLVPMQEIEKRRQAGSGVGELGPEELEALADGYRMTGDAAADEVEDGLAEAGLPRGMLSAPGSDPWATTDIRVMMGGMADTADAMAEGQRQAAQEEPARVGPDLTMVRRFELVGSEPVDGRPAFHLVADDLGHAERTGGGEQMTMDRTEVWIDEQEYVPLRFLAHGTVTNDGETRPVTLERISSDYRRVPNSDMYESYAQVMRIQGQLDPEQQKQMQEAEAQMEQLETQLASMPEAQRQMIMARMGPQLEMMRSMASGQGLEFRTTIQRIEVNPTEIPDVAAAMLPFSPRGSSGAMPSRGEVPAAPETSPGTSATAPADVDAAAAAAGGSVAEAQRRCLAGKLAAAEARPPKRGLGGLFGAVRKAAQRIGNAAPGAHRAPWANAAVEEQARSAASKGVAPSEIDACREPG